MTNTTTSHALAAEQVEMNGETVFRVALTGRDGAGEFALFDAEGLDTLRWRGAQALYLVNDGHGNRYVTFLRKPSNHSASAARAIVNCPSDRRISFLSGNRLDLRASNIAVGARKGETPEEMAQLKAHRMERQRHARAKGHDAGWAWWC